MVSLTSCKQEDCVMPQDVVDAFLSPYSAEEKERVQFDEKNIESLLFRHKKPAAPKQRVYVATAGAPGTSKSTMLEAYLAEHPAVAQACVYIDPDQRALKLMTATYWQSLTCYKISGYYAYQDCAKVAYNHWRGASNYIANTMLNKAFREGFSIAHGTTSQSPQIAKMYECLRTKGYEIVLLVCLSDSKNRVNAIQSREKTQGFVQSTQHDFVEKEKAVLKNFPTYFKYADVIHVYWVEQFDKGASRVGTFTQKAGWSLNTKNQKWLKKIKALYEANRVAGMPSFKALLQPGGEVVH